MTEETKAERKVTKDRKFKAFIGAFVAAAIMLGMERITGDQWVEMSVYLFGLFMGGNALEHWSKKP